MNKLENLKVYLKNLERVVVAFSSGVDSTFLLKAAHDVLGDNVIAVTAKSYLFPDRELNEAVNFCSRRGIKHIIFDFDGLNIQGFSQNPPNRCYLCKKELFTKIWTIAKENGIKKIIEGSNLDDNEDYRPGLTALKELNIKSPLNELGFSKNDIRKFSKELGLLTAEKPSFACLSSRIEYGEKITKDKLKMVERAEQLILDLGLHQVRVRIHSNIARIEVMPEEFEKLLGSRQMITQKLKEFGFAYITMDLFGYRSGSMNETLQMQEG